MIKAGTRLACGLMMLAAAGCATKTVPVAAPDYSAIVKKIAFQPMDLPSGDVKRIDKPGFPALAAYDGSDQPMFGDIAKTKAMEAADAAFLAAAQKGGFANERGSDLAVHYGWQAVAKNDLAAAVRRFNEAWLLDPENGNAYDGFGYVMALKGRSPAEAFFKGGIAKRHVGSVLINYGVLLIKTGKPSEAVKPLEAALAFPDVAASAEALLAVAYFGAGDKPSACLHAAKASDSAFKTWRDLARDFQQAGCAGS